MVANHRWGKVKEQLKAASGRDFERRVLPLLRILWPNLANPSALGNLDKSGIDHVLVGDGHPLTVVVQCKGFVIQEDLGKSQIAQVRGSVRSFLASSHQCVNYVLLYNRQGVDRSFAKDALAELQRIREKGRAEIVELWDLDVFQKRINAALMNKVVDEIARIADSESQVERSRFKFGQVVLTEIPYQIGELFLRRHDTPKMSMPEAITFGDPGSVLLQSHNDRRWTLVYGLFGSGKSTLSRRMSEISKRRLLYVPAWRLRHSESGSPSENSFASALVDYLGIFDGYAEFTDDDRATLYWLAGPLMAAILRTPDSNVSLLIDGLDEHRLYASLRGLQLLTTELSRVQCQVILTTRREHFLDHYAAYTDPLGAGSRFANERLGLLELREWSLTQILRYLDEATQYCDGLQQSRLRDFRIGIESKAIDAGPLQHPLILAITADLVAEEGMSVMTNTADLYQRWTRAKLMRDFREKARKTPLSYDNIDKLIFEILALMSDVAYAMTACAADGKIELTESTTEDLVHRLAIERFGQPVPSDLYTVTAFLEPAKRRTTAGGLVLRFFHRSFHEYFLALALRARKIDSSNYDLPIRKLALELTSLDEA